jgi:hypothetical protein
MSIYRDNIPTIQLFEDLGLPQPKNILGLDKGLSQIPRKTWRFFNCVPTSIGQRDYGYSENEGVRNFNTLWTFDNYEINSNLYLSVSEMIKAINPFY